MSSFKYFYAYTRTHVVAIGHGYLRRIYTVVDEQSREFEQVDSDAVGFPALALIPRPRTSPDQPSYPFLPANQTADSAPFNEEGAWEAPLYLQTRPGNGEPVVLIGMGEVFHVVDMEDPDDPPPMSVREAREEREKQNGVPSRRSPSNPSMRAVRPDDSQVQVPKPDPPPIPASRRPSVPGVS